MKKIKPKYRVNGKAEILQINDKYFWTLSTTAVNMVSVTEFYNKTNCKRSLVHFAERYGIDIIKGGN